MSWWTSSSQKTSRGFLDKIRLEDSESLEMGELRSGMRCSRKKANVFVGAKRMIILGVLAVASKKKKHAGGFDVIHRTSGHAIGRFATRLFRTLTALINSQFLRTSMRLFSSSAKSKNFKLWYNKTLLDLKKLDTYRTFPVFPIYLCTLSKSALPDQTESLTKSGFAEDAARVSAGGFLYPSVSRKSP